MKCKKRSSLETEEYYSIARFYFPEKKAPLKKTLIKNTLNTPWNVVFLNLFSPIDVV